VASRRTTGASAFIRKSDLRESSRIRLEEVLRGYTLRPSGSRATVVIIRTNVYDDDCRLMYAVGFVDAATGKYVYRTIQPGELLNAVEAFRQFAVLMRTLRVTRKALTVDLLYECWFAAELDTNPSNGAARQRGNRISRELGQDLWTLLAMPVGSMPPSVQALWDCRPRI
jgi:hypothetical protein